MSWTSPKSESTELFWYWKRLKNAPPAELFYRAAQLGKKNVDKYFAGSKARRLTGCSPARIHYLDTTAYRDAMPESVERLLTTAEDIVEHRFEIFGIPTEFGAEINWHLDPKTHRSWPLKFWGDIDYRDGFAIGGIKFAWELNRLHHLPQLAIAFVLTNEQKYEDEIFAQLRLWLDANPYPRGINWISGIELGIRLVNLVYALKFLNKPLSAENNDLAAAFVHLHATHLYRYPSKYTSAANHALAEALGLFVAGLTFPGLNGAANWKKFGQDVLEHEAGRQIYPDGSSFEHSFPYLQFVLDHFLIYFLLCREHDEKCDRVVGERMKASLRFIHDMMDGAGNFPAIGDDDSGYLLKLWPGATHNNFLSLLNTGAILFGDSSLNYALDGPDSKTLLLLRDAAKPNGTPPGRSAAEDRPTFRYYPDAGLAVIRDGRAREMLFVGNSGPLGLKPLAAHGHADALSFWLSVQGNPVFVDPGTYLYHDGGRWRQYFRSTAAHNTVRVDCLDQATIVSDFIFDDFYDVSDAALRSEDNSVVWTATHNGFQRLSDPVLHKRTVTYSRQQPQLTVADDILCKERHLIECFFHLHPACGVKTDDNVIQIVCNGPTIELRVDERWDKIDIIRGDKDYRGGWYSAAFNRLEQATTIKLSANVTGSASFTSCLKLDNAIS